MVSLQRTPAWLPVDVPSAPAYTSVDIMFTPSHIDIKLTAGERQNLFVHCRFECAASFEEPQYPDVVMIALNSSQLINGTSDAFDCLSPAETATGLFNQTLMSLMRNNCGNGTGPGLNGTNYFELQFRPYYSNPQSVSSNWLQNLTFQTLSGSDFNTYPVTNPAYGNSTFSFIPWMQCPCDENACPDGFANMDVTLSLRAVRAPPR